MSTVAIIDADPLVYEVGFACSKFIEIDGDVISVSNVPDACNMMDALIKDICLSLSAKKYILCLSDLLANWRKGIDPTYKQHRRASKRPGCFGALRLHVSRNHHADVWPTLEADDMCGVLGTAAVKGEERVIVSIDKDLLTVPGSHFNPHKPQLGVRVVSSDEAHTYHMTQTLTGDSTDNYPGCPKIGPKKAAAILGGAIFPDTWERVVKAYERAGQTGTQALIQANLAFILRSGFYLCGSGNIELWHPTRGSVPYTKRDSLLCV